MRVTETPAQRPAIDFASFDPNVRIQDDLFRHVNGTWLNTTEIPADKPLTGAFMELRDQAEAAVRDIITTLDGGTPASDEARIADLYAATSSGRRIVFTRGWPASGAHTIGIRLLSTTGRRTVDVDGFTVVR